MSSIKHLVTSGCSFSLSKTTRTPDEGDGWPHWLSESLGAELHNTAMGSQGNDLIARKAIHKVNELLNLGTNPADILVGIMWSGAERKDFYSSTVPYQFPINENGWLRNPEHFVESEQEQGGWVIMSPGWLHHYSKIWYTEFSDQVGSHINTYERIHWTQCYLKTVGVKYFMGTYMSNVVNFMNHDGQRPEQAYCANCRKDPNIEWLHNSIEWQHFLPVPSYSEWCAHNFSDFQDFNDHPNDRNAQEFNNRVIVPFVKDHLKIAINTQ